MLELFRPNKENLREVKSLDNRSRKFETANKMDFLLHDLRNVATLVFSTNYFIRLRVGEEELPESFVNSFARVSFLLEPKNISNLDLSALYIALNFYIIELSQLSRLFSDLDLEFYEDIASSLSSINLMLDMLDSYLEGEMLMKKQVNVIDVAQDLLEKFKPLTKDIEFDVNHLFAADYKIEIDLVMFERVMVNLIMNAVSILKKFKVKDPKIRFLVYEKDQNLYFSIEDNGPGLPSGNCEQLFEEGYSNLNNSTGLGLAYVKRFVGLHGISLKCGANDMGGASFSIKF